MKLPGLASHWFASRPSRTLCARGGLERGPNVQIDDAQRLNAKLLMSRERELLTLSRKQDRYRAWLEVIRGLDAADVAATERNEILRRTADSLKRTLAFQRVAFFEQCGNLLRPVTFESDGERYAAIALTAATVLLSAKDGHIGESSEHGDLKRTLGLERFLWHWAGGAQSSVLLVAGYDRERAPFYPGFDGADRAQFGIFGAQVDRLLDGLPERRGPSSGAHGLMGPPNGALLPYGLSGRELDVSRWLARGKSNKEIASILGISPRTVQIHVAHIFDKVGIRSRAGAASMLVQRDVVGAQAASTTRG